MTGIKLVVADRSASIRAVIRRMVEGDGVRVVGETHDGHDVIELLRTRAADGLVADLDLDGLAGRELMAAVYEAWPVPVFVLTPAARTSTTRIAFAAHELGVVAVNEKPGLPDGWVELGRSLRRSILEVWQARREDGPIADQPDDTPVIGPDLRFVAIGASAGGPGALRQLLQALGGQPKLAVAVVQHISAGFETALVEWLATETGLDVAVARNGEALHPGCVRLAPSAGNMVLRPDGCLRVLSEPPGAAGNGPSVDGLFDSLLDHPPPSVAAILLSGMGSDGAGAMSRLKSSGVLTIAQDRESCAVYGMPRVAVEANAVSISLNPGQIGRLLSRATGPGP